MIVVWREIPEFPSEVGGVGMVMIVGRMERRSLGWLFFFYLISDCFALLTV